MKKSNDAIGNRTRHKIFTLFKSSINKWQQDGFRGFGGWGTGTEFWLGDWEGKENYGDLMIYGDNIKTDLMATCTENLQWIEVT